MSPLFPRRKQPAPQPPSSLFDPTTVDLVASTRSGDARLYIVRDQQWTGSDPEIRSLQEKIHNYVGFALDGGMVALYPELTAQPWAIVIDTYTGRPDARTIDVLQRTGDVVRQYGGELVLHELRPPEGPGLLPMTVSVTKLGTALDPSEPFDL